MGKRLDPGDVIERTSVEKLAGAADRAFQAVSDPRPLMAKPFGSPADAPQLLFNLSLLLGGLHLGRTMRVVEFGSGTCWLSRHLNQLGSATVSVDPSPTALEIGQRLFREHPIIGGEYVEDPRFLLFDGRRIDLDDASVDRVVCFDSFHHVPNQREVLREFHRILKPGGIAGFSEPGRRHGRDEQSQHEMRAHDVLENDVILEEIRRIAFEEGFNDLMLKLWYDPGIEMSYRQYESLFARSLLARLRHPLAFAAGLRKYFRLTRSLMNMTVFFLVKGRYEPDTRNSFVAKGGSPAAGEARDLRHEMRTDRESYEGRRGEPIEIAVEVTNAGTVKWLHENIVDVAVVKLGAHLHDGESNLVDFDFHRSRFDRDVSPGETVRRTLSLRFEKPGQFVLVLDLVSENICWFEPSGSKPARVRVTIR